MRHLSFFSFVVIWALWLGDTSLWSVAAMRVLMEKEVLTEWLEK